MEEKVINFVLMDIGKKTMEEINLMSLKDKEAEAKKLLDKINKKTWRK